MKRFFTILSILVLSFCCFAATVLLVRWWNTLLYQVYIPPKKANLTNSNKAKRALFNIKLNGKYGCIDIEGKIAIKPKFDNIQCSTDELMAFGQNEKWGFISQAGEIILEPQFSLIPTGYSNYFSEGLAVVCMNDKCGYIDSTGKYVIEPKFDYAENFSEEIAVAQIDAYDFLGYRLSNSKSVFINKEGKILFPKSNVAPQFRFSEGLAKGWIGEKLVYIDKTGEIALNSQEIDIGGDFSEGLATFSPKGVYRYGYADKKGQIVIPAQFKQAGAFQEGLAQVMFENGKYGFIDKTGKTVIEPQFEYADTFYEGRAVISVGKKWGYIDKTGKIVIPLQFGSSERFVNGLAGISFDDQNLPYEQTRYGYIDKLGNIVWEPTN
jgi:hypothetical protein